MRKAPVRGVVAAGAPRGALAPCGSAVGAPEPLAGRAKNPARRGGPRSRLGFYTDARRPPSVEVTVGHTPDADDAFMFYAMLTGKVGMRGLEVRHTVEDIETLNRAGAGGGAPDITAASVHACAHMPGHTILRSGGSFGLGYGPLVVARGGATMGDVLSSRVAVPGRLTSAFLLMRLMAGEFEHEEMRFSDIPAAVASGRSAAGIVIHETQLTHESEGLRKVADLGEWWHERTGGLPVPLGVNVARTSLGDGVISRFDACLRDSIQYGLDHFGEAMDYAMQYSRSKPRGLVERFVKMYVNRVTVEMGEAGEESIGRLLSMGREAGLVPTHVPRVAAKG